MMVELTKGAFEALPYKARLFLRMLEKEVTNGNNQEKIVCDKIRDGVAMIKKTWYDDCISYYYFVLWIDYDLDTRRLQLIFCGMYLSGQGNPPLIYKEHKPLNVYEADLDKAYEAATYFIDQIKDVGKSGSAEESYKHWDELNGKIDKLVCDFKKRYGHD